MQVMALLLSATVCGAAKEMRSSGPGHVTLKITAKPLGDVLDCLSEATGVEVVYDGVSTPTDRVTASVEDAPISEALDALFQGQKLKYALAIDPKGAKGGVVIISAGTGDGRHEGAAPRTSVPTPLPSDPEGMAPPQMSDAPKTPTPDPTPQPMLIGDIPQIPGISVPGVTKVPTPAPPPPTGGGGAALFPEPGALTPTTR